MSTDLPVQAASSPAADPHDGQHKSISDSARLLQEIEARLQGHDSNCDLCHFLSDQSECCDDARLLRAALTQLRASVERIEQLQRHAVVDNLAFSSANAGLVEWQIRAEEAEAKLTVSAEREERLRALTEKWRATAAEGSERIRREPAVEVFDATLLSCADELDAALQALGGPEKEKGKTP